MCGAGQPRIAHRGTVSRIAVNWGRLLGRARSLRCAHLQVLHNLMTIASTYARKPLNTNRIEEHRDLKEGFALHCSRPPASR